MTSIADGSVKIQTTPESNISTPSWFGEVVLISKYLRAQGVFNKINEQVRFARKRFGRYEIIDFLAVLFGYVISRERTLEEFYQRLQPFADWMMCALLATEAANVGRLFAPAQPFLRPIVTNGSAVLETGGTGDIERNCAKDSLPLVSIWLHTSFRKNARCCGSMVCMGPELCFPIWLSSHLSPVAKNMVCSITHWFRRVCTCLLTSFNNARKARWSAVSTTARRSRWGQRVCATV